MVSVPVTALAVVLRRTRVPPVTVVLGWVLKLVPLRTSVPGPALIRPTPLSEAEMSMSSAGGPSAMVKVRLEVERSTTPAPLMVAVVAEVAVFTAPMMRSVPPD